MGNSLKKFPPSLKHIVVVLIDNDENVFKIMMTSTIHKPA